MISGKEAGRGGESRGAVPASPAGALQSQVCLLEEAQLGRNVQVPVPDQASHWLGLLRDSVTWAQCDIVKVLRATCSAHRWTVNAFQEEI